MVVSYTLNGKQLPVEEIKTLGTGVDIQGDTLTILRTDLILRSSIKLDPTKKPKTLDVTAQFLRMETTRMIHELDGDNLKWCWNEPGKERPSVFDAAKASGLLVPKRK